MIKGYITNLGKYNEGYLVGEWIEFPIDEDELQEVFKRIGINEQYEEYFFTDWECELDTGFGEYVSVTTVNELAEELEGEDVELIKAIIEATGCDLSEAFGYVRKSTFFQGMTLEELAHLYVDDQLPDFAKDYFDYEAWAENELIDWDEVENGVILIE